MSKEDLLREFKNLFPQWGTAIASYRKTGSKTLVIKFYDGKSRVFLYDSPDNWQFGTKLWRKRPERAQKKDDFHNIILTDRKAAEGVVEEMRRRIQKYGVVSVADLFDLVGITASFPNGNNLIWDDEQDIGIRRVSSGFLISVLEPKKCARFSDYFEMAVYEHCHKCAHNDGELEICKDCTMSGSKPSNFELRVNKGGNKNEEK